MKTKFRPNVGAIRSQSVSPVIPGLFGASIMKSSGQGGEDDGLGRLRERAMAGFDELEPKLRRMIEKRIPPRSQSKVDVDGIFQSARIGLLQSLESRQPKTDAELISWIFNRTWSRWQDEMRKWRTEARQVDREYPLPSGSDIALAKGIGVLTDIGFKETVERIREALDPEDFLIVEQRIVDEHSFVEIGELLNSSPKTISRRYLRALLRIREVVASPFSSSP